MALGLPSPKKTIDDLRKSKISPAIRVAVALGIIAIGASYYSYTLYVGNQEAKTQVNALNGKMLELNAKVLQTAELEQKLAASEATVSVLGVELADNKTLLLQASEALEKCTPRLPKKSANSVATPASK